MSKDLDIFSNQFLLLQISICNTLHSQLIDNQYIEKIFIFLIVLY